MFNVSILRIAEEKSQERGRFGSLVEFSPRFSKNGTMKKLWFPLLALAVFFVGCTSDHTLETLIPHNALAVVLVDHPGLVAQVMGPGTADLPWKSLDGGKPWAAAVLPSNPPGILIALALADQSSAWATVEAWAKERGGLAAVRLGSYAVLTSPGQPSPGTLDPDLRFDLTRVRVGGDPLAVYFDVKNIMAEADLPESFRPAFAALPWAEKNLQGIRLGFNAKDGGLELRLASDGKPGSDFLQSLKALPSSADLSLWTGLFPQAAGFGVAVSLPQPLMDSASSLIPDPALAHRASALIPLVGPRLAVAVAPRADGSWAWSSVLEARDPQAVRQALKTLIASGELQKSFAAFALDTDTPLIYQDKPDGAGGVRAVVSLGSLEFNVGYGTDRIAVTGGNGAVEALPLWLKESAAPAAWYHEAPGGSEVVASGSLDGMGARAAVKILSDGNAELRLWVDAAGLKVWEERLPQAIGGWLSSVK